MRPALVSGKLRGLWLNLSASVLAFSAYFCMYAFRKPFADRLSPKPRSLLDTEACIRGDGLPQRPNTNHPAAAIATSSTSATTQTADEPCRSAG